MPSIIVLKRNTLTVPGQGVAQGRVHGYSSVGQDLTC